MGFKNERGNLYGAFVKVVNLVKPVIFVAENVYGLLTMKKNDETGLYPIEQILNDFSSIGYDVKYQLIKCENFGIPQTRWRVIIMGVNRQYTGRLPDGWNLITENQTNCHVQDGILVIYKNHRSHLILLNNSIRKQYIVTKVKVKRQLI